MLTSGKCELSVMLMHVTRKGKWQDIFLEPYQILLYAFLMPDEFRKGNGERQ